MAAPNDPLIPEPRCTQSLRPSLSEATPGPGTAFWFPSQMEENFIVAHGLEILLVEDNPNDEMLALNAFKKFNVVNHVFVVRDGAEALDYLFCTGAYAQRPIENPSVILLDLKLPVVDGIEVLRRIRSDPRTRMIPVVVLTSSNEQRDLIETYNLGVNSYIVKPVDFEQFNDVARHLGYYWLLLNRQPTAVSGSSPPIIPTPLSSTP